MYGCPIKKLLTHLPVAQPLKVSVSILLSFESFSEFIV